MKQFALGMLAAIVLLTICGFVYLRFGFAEVRGDVHPSGFESYPMRAAVHAAVRRNAAQISNPVQPTDENLIAGGKQYLGECAGCHGTPGKADKFPGSLNPDAPQFPTGGRSTRRRQVFWVAKHGIRRTGMFANGMWDSDEELWRFAAYIKRMKQPASACARRVSEESENRPSLASKGGTRTRGTSRG